MDEPSREIAQRRLGIGLLVASIGLIACSDAIAKAMTASVPVTQIALVQATVMVTGVPLLARERRLLSLVRTRRPWLQLVRSACHLGSGLCFYTAVKYLPLAETIAIIFVGPLLVTVLAALVLREHVGPRRWTACLVGLAGAMVVVRPGADGLGWVALYPLAATTLHAVYVVCTRALAPTEHTATMLTYSALPSVVVLGLAAPWFWVAPGAVGWVALVGIGVIACVSVVLAIRAYALAPASLLAPYSYVEIVFGSVLGLVLFGDVPDAMTVLGAGIIVASGLYVYHREARARG
ncbi:MAG: DMT family transporter [Ectothiorhodospiraceae bacterium]|nr:DMT family transporter [Ectothiorhodospiraceae bacterium]